MNKIFLPGLAALAAWIGASAAPVAAFDYSQFPSPIYQALRAGALASEKGTVSPGTVDPATIYRSAYPGVLFDDTLQAVLDVKPGDARDNLAAVAAYVRNQGGGARTPPAGKGNGVAFFGSQQIAADYSATWGLNTICTDNTGRVASSGVGRICVGAELDFNITSPNTQLIGVSIGGNSIAQSTNANGFLVNTLGNGNKWGAAYWSLDGVAQYGLVLGALESSGANVASQPIYLGYFDSNSAHQTTILQAANGYFTISGNPNGIATRGNLSLDAGQFVAVGGVPVIGSRKTGWTPGVGTPNRDFFDADYTQTIAPTYSQAQVQALQDQVVKLSQRVLALETDLRGHGLIGQ